jgi:hypothetical protein
MLVGIFFCYSESVVLACVGAEATIERIGDIPLLAFHSTHTASEHDNIARVNGGRQNARLPSNTRSVDRKRDVCAIYCDTTCCLRGRRQRKRLRQPYFANWEEKHNASSKQKTASLLGRRLVEKVRP